MSLRAKVWARKARADLFAKLGPVCIACGVSRKSRLTFDCIIPQGDWHHKLSTDARMTFYRRQHEAGNVQVLCRACNSRKGNQERAEKRQREAAKEEPCPF